RNRDWRRHGRSARGDHRCEIDHVIEVHVDRPGARSRRINHYRIGAGYRKRYRLYECRWSAGCRISTRKHRAVWIENLQMPGAAETSTGDRTVDADAFASDRFEEQSQISARRSKDCIDGWAICHDRPVVIRI